MIKAIASALFVFLWALFSGNALAMSAEEYDKLIDRSCDTDNDCTIKNVGGCCGIYNECVNKNSFADPALKDQICIANKLIGICVTGSGPHSHCICKDNKCKEMQDIKAIEREIKEWKQENHITN